MRQPGRRCGRGQGAEEAGQEVPQGGRQPEGNADTNLWQEAREGGSGEEAGG